MKRFIATLKPSLIAMLLLTILFGFAYPLFIWGIGEIFFHKEANGSLLYKEGKVVGSALIGQNFTSAQYFHPRPSSAGDKGYDAANSSGSNLGPTSQKLIDDLTKRASAYRTENKLASDAKIPADTVTGSGSGLDPHISVENAMLQAGRVAAARGMSEQEIKRLIETYIEGRSLWLFGDERVNVLRLNLALDNMIP